jgi:hypothetical protein
MADFATQEALYSALTALGLRAYDSAPQQADGASRACGHYFIARCNKPRDGPADDQTKKSPTR